MFVLFGKYAITLFYPRMINDSNVINNRNKEDKSVKSNNRINDKHVKTPLASNTTMRDVFREQKQECINNGVIMPLS